MLWHGKNFRGFLNKASQVLFNKMGTTLNSTNVQDAISEIDSNLISIQLSTLYTCSLTSKIGALGGYRGGITLTDVPANCFLIMPIGGARNTFDGGKYGVVGNYNAGIAVSTEWYVNGAEAGDYYVRFAYFCINN